MSLASDVAEVRPGSGAPPRRIPLALAEEVFLKSLDDIRAKSVIRTATDT